MENRLLSEIVRKPEKRVIGLMSGTSADGMDAALVKIRGWGTRTRVELLAFASLPYSDAVRQTILKLASGDKGGAHELCLFSFLLGKLSLDACRKVCEKAGVGTDEIDLVGSHGQTLWHIPAAEEYLGFPVAGTLQMGEPSVIAEGLGCPVVSDFRVRDLAAGGQGAPLVPYTEFLLYRRENETVALQNIGGIGNITILPAGCSMEDVRAFDTGPGNMVIDQLVFRMTGGKMRYDEDGRICRTGTVCPELLDWMTRDPYLWTKPPKTTGRERYGESYVNRLVSKAGESGVSDADLLATATCFTAKCVEIALREYCPERPSLLIAGGGGVRNPALMDFLKKLLPIPVKTNEETGMNSDAKEAIAFAILANECIHASCNNLPSVTGASHPVVMGKITQ